MNMGHMNETIQPVKMFLIFVPPQHDQFYRPYESNLNGDTLNNMVQATNNGTLLGESSMVSAAHGILTPSITPGDKLSVPNGMNNSRYAFYLEVLIRGIYGSRREIISGFTNYPGVATSGAIDPNMIMHINNIIEVKESEIVGPTGSSMMRAVSGNYQVMTNELSNNDDVAMRPEDIISAGQVKLMMSGESDLVDTRVYLSGEPKLSERNNTLPGRFLSDVCTGYINAANSTGDAFDSTEAMYEKALSMTRMPSYGAFKFISAIDDRGLSDRSMFTYGELEAKWQLPPDFCTMLQPDFNNVMGAPIENTQHWGGANVETNIAFSLAHELPPIMSKYMLLSAIIETNNMNGSPMVTVLSYAEMFEGMMTADKLRAFENDILQNIVRGTISANVNFFDIKLEVRMMSNNLISISIDGKPHVPYVVPMFCDSYYTPVMNNSYDNLRIMNNAIETLVDNLAPNISEQFDLLGSNMGMMDSPNVETQQMSQFPRPGTI